MKFFWLKFLLLATFVFWASGLAKYTHEALEHHGRDASVDNDDDDDQSVTVAGPQGATHQQQSGQPVKHPCPICQMLAAMTVDRSTPPDLPPLRTDIVGTLIISDWLSPAVNACFTPSARGPPAACA
jgi:hypothetical protein